MVWEDNGLWFTLILNSIALAVLGPLAWILYVKRDEDKTLKRVLRPNRQGRIHDEQTLPPVAKEDQAGASIFAVPTIGKMLSVDRYVIGGPAAEDGKPLLLDPRVAMFSFFLKLGVILFALGSLGTLWLVPTYATDDYLEVFAKENDPRDCHGKHNDSSACGDDTYCRYFNETDRCEPNPPMGLTDFSLQNVTPKGFRVYLTSVFGIVFALAVAFVTHRFCVAIVDYASFLLPLQARHCDGCKVVIVRGVPVPDKVKVATENEPVAEDGDADKKKKKKKPKDRTISNDEYSAQFKEDYLSSFANTAGILDVAPIRAPPKDFEDNKVLVDDMTLELRNAVAEERVAEPDEKTGEKKPIMKKVPPKLKEERATDYYEKELRKAVESLNEDIARAPEEDFLGVFVIDTDSNETAARLIEHVQTEHGGCTSGVTAMIAGEADGIQWENAGNSKFSGWAKFFVVVLIFIALVFFWSVPVAFLGSLDSLSSFPVIGGVFSAFTNNVPTTIRGILQAYLPVIVLAIFNIVLPPMIRVFSLMSGAITRNEVDSSSLVMLFVFMVMSGVVMQAVLQGGLFQLAAVIRDPTREAIFAMIVGIVSPAGGFWYAKVITAGCLGRWIFALQLGPVITSKILAPRSTTQQAYDEFFAVRQPGLGGPAFPITVWYAQTLVVMAIGIFFHVTVPLLSFFVFVYFLSSYFVFHGVIMDASRPVGFRPEERLTDFMLPVRWMGIIINLYIVAAFGTIVMAVMKESYGALGIAVISLVVGFLCHVYLHVKTELLRNPIHHLVQGSSPFFSILTADTPSQIEDPPPTNNEWLDEEEENEEQRMEFLSRFRPDHMTKAPMDADDLVTTTVKEGNTEVVQWAHDKAQDEGESLKNDKRRHKRLAKGAKFCTKIS